MYKNKLQEFCQKNKIDLPFYDTYSMKELKTITWISNVEYDGILFTSDKFASKKEAEKSVAQSVLDYINSSAKKSLPPRSCILYDAENMGNFIDQINLHYENVDIYYFVNRNHHSINKEYPNVIKMISEACDRDGSDCYLMLTLGTFLFQDKYDYYFVSTRDHFANSLSTLVQNNSPYWSSKTCKIITRIEDLEEF